VVWDFFAGGELHDLGRAVDRFDALAEAKRDPILS
jgi:hypothetical protein